MQITIKLVEKTSPTFEIPGLCQLSALSEPQVLEQSIEIKDTDGTIMDMLLKAVKGKRITIPAADIKGLQEAYAKTLSENGSDASAVKDTYFVGLSKSAMIWESSDNEIHLSRFNGKTYIKLEKKNPPTELQLREINNAIATGVLVKLATEPKVAKVEDRSPEADSDFDAQLDTQAKRLRLILDSPYEEFREMLKGMKPNEVAQLYKIEKKENDRKNYLDLMAEQLPELLVTK